jgi:hypothetical protein
MLVPCSGSVTFSGALKKDLYRRIVNSDRPDIIKKVEYEDLSIDY